MIRCPSECMSPESYHSFSFHLKHYTFLRAASLSSELSDPCWRGRIQWMITLLRHRPQANIVPQLQWLELAIHQHSRLCGRDSYAPQFKGILPLYGHQAARELSRAPSHLPQYRSRFSLKTPAGLADCGFLGVT